MLPVYNYPPKFYLQDRKKVAGRSVGRFVPALLQGCVGRPRVLFSFYFFLIYSSLLSFFAGLSASVPGSVACQSYTKPHQPRRFSPPLLRRLDCT